MGIFKFTLSPSWRTTSPRPEPHSTPSNQCPEEVSSISLSTPPKVKKPRKSGTANLKKTVAFNSEVEAVVELHPEIQPVLTLERLKHSTSRTEENQPSSRPKAKKAPRVWSLSRMFGMFRASRRPRPGGGRPPRKARRSVGL